MEVIIKAEPKEIAALVVAIQERRCKNRKDLKGAEKLICQIVREEIRDMREDTP